MFQQSVAELTYESFVDSCNDSVLQVSSTKQSKSTSSSINQMLSSISNKQSNITFLSNNIDKSDGNNVSSKDSISGSSSSYNNASGSCSSDDSTTSTIDIVTNKIVINTNNNEDQATPNSVNQNDDYQKNESATMSLLKESINVPFVPCTTKSGPGQRSNKEILLLQSNIIKAKNEAAAKFAIARNKLDNKNKRLSKGFLKGMLYDINMKYNLEGKHAIQATTIRSRLKFNRKVIVQQEGNTSPLLKLENIAVDLLIKCGEMNQPLSCEQGLGLIRSLVKNDTMKQEISSWIRKNCHPKSEDEELIGAGYWRNFMKRNKDKLQSKRGKLFPQSRDDWCTYDNLKEMYDMIYDLLTKAGVAKILETPQYMDKFGNIVDEASAYGLMVKHEITHPDYFIHVDEFGDNLDMTKDKPNAGQKFIVGKNHTPNIGVSSNNLHYTVLGFTAATGEPIFCAIILAKENADQDDGVKLNVVTGIDVLCDQPIDVDNLQASFDEKGVFSGGPKCLFRGKEVPCYVTTSQKGGMNSRILTSLFQYMDNQNLFPRRENGPLPFVLIDGHGSRFGLDFLSYINDPDHLWYVCLGLPYGTHKWQVADSEEQNGAMRCSIGNIKRKRLREKQKLGFNGLSVYDVVFIVKEAWNDSFARVDSNKKALCERGWNPLNYALLTDETLMGLNSTKKKENGGNIDMSLVDKLNVDDGIACDVISMLAQRQDQEKKRQRQEVREKRSKTSQAILNDAKKITSGLVFSAGNVHLDDHILSIVKTKVEVESKRKFEIEEKNKRRKIIKEEKVNKIIKSRTCYKTWTNDDLKVMCGYFKKKDMQQFLHVRMIFKNIGKKLKKIIHKIFWRKNLRVNMKLLQEKMKKIMRMMKMYVMIIYMMEFLHTVCRVVCIYILVFFLYFYYVSFFIIIIVDHVSIMNII